MKKLFPILMLMALTFGATVLPTNKTEAQSTASFVSQYGNVLDTVVTGSLTKDFTLTNQITSSSNIVEIQFTATKISGTVGGTVTVQTSLDGTDWYTAQGTSAYTLTDATQTTSFKITNYCAKYIRIRSVGTGTMSAQIKAKYVARKVAIAKP
jgi:hypothetical protein